MTINEIKKAHVARPFRPFTIVMGDGSRYRVTHPEVMAMHPKAERTFIVYAGPNEEDHVVLDILLVTALEFGNLRSSRNGAPRRK